MLKYAHPTLALVMAHWAPMILVPAVLLLLAVLAMITRWWDGRRGSNGGPSAGRARCECWTSWVIFSASRKASLCS